MKIVQMVRFASAVASTYLGPIGQIVVDLGSKALRIQDGVTPGGFVTMLTNNNLSDLPDPAAARNNLGLGSAATHAAGDFDTAGSAATALAAAEAYTDIETAARIAAVAAETARATAAENLKLAKASNLSDVASAATSRGNLGLGAAALKGVLGNQANFATVFGVQTDGDILRWDNLGNITGVGINGGNIMTKSANLSDLANLPTARNNLDVYSKAQVNSIGFNQQAPAVSNSGAGYEAMGGASSGIFIVQGDDGAGNAFYDIVLFAQFGAGSLGSLQTDVGAPGARNYASLISTTLYLSRTGGPAVMNCQIQLH